MTLMAGGMNCKQVDECLDDYLDGEMSWSKRLRFRMHVFVCKACAAYLTTYRKTIELVKGSFDRPDTDEQVDEGLVQSILDARDPTDKTN